MANDFEIILTATDNATAGINRVKGALAEVEKETQGLKKTTAETGNTIQNQFKEAGKELKEFRRTMFLVTSAFATMVVATREASKFSREAKNTYDDFTASIRVLSTTVGEMFAPALEGVTYIVNLLSDSITTAIAGFIKLTSFIASFFDNIRSGPIEAYKLALETANIATDQFLNKIEASKARASANFTLEIEAAEIKKFEETTKKSAKVVEKSFDGMVAAVNALGGAMIQAQDINKSWAKAAAVVALGLAIMNTAVGVTNALRDYPFPVSLIIGGLIAAAGAIQIATIASQKFHDGGMIRAHNGLAVDEVPIIAQTGEGVLSRRGMAALGGAGMLNRLNAGGGGGAYINIEINYPTVRSDADIDALTEEISQRLAREADRL